MIKTIDSLIINNCLCFSHVRKEVIIYAPTGTGIDAANSTALAVVILKINIINSLTDRLQLYVS